MHKDKILSLRDLALEHLPKVREQRDLMSKHGRTIALQAVAGGPLKTFYNPASTAIEKRAAALLNLVHQHPDTTTEGLYPAEDDMGAALEAVLLDDARKMQPETEAAMLEDARLLCELSGSPLPPWMIDCAQQPAPAQTPATPAPVGAASNGPATLPAVPNWKMLIQAEAAELFLKLLASGANPTPHSLVKPMAKWCRDNEIKTDGNINPSEGYIRTHVLGGDHWTQPTMNREQAKKHVAQVAQVAQAKVAQVAH